MYTFEECQDIINKAIQNIDLRKEPKRLYQPVEYILSIGGKRIRPALAIMACNMFNDNVNEAIEPAIGLEIFHNFTLIHDDIMDNSPIRRSQPTVHHKWDTNIAILSGDAMNIIAFKYFLTVKPEKQFKVLNEFTNTAIKVCEGQQYDMDFETRNNVSVDEYIEMISLKTSVLLACCIKIGAIIGGAGDNDANSLYQFGKYMGIAFQLQDDLLDVYGDPEKFGKKCGNDIAANKKTYLLIKAFEQAKGEDYKLLKYLVENKDVNENEKIEKTIGIYNKLNIKKITEEKIEEYFKNAMQNFKNVKLQQNKKAEMNGFINILLNRSY